MKKVKCSACKGLGQTAASRSEVKFVKYKANEKMPEGSKGMRMVTVRQGSGCHNCHGVGYTEVESS